MSERLRIAAVGDLHVGEHGGSRDWNALFIEMSAKAQVIALCGDLTNVGSTEEAERLARALRQATVPVVGVLGNHDHESGQSGTVERLLIEGGMRPLEQRTQELMGVGFAGVKGYGGGFGEHLLSSFGEPATKEFVGEAVREAMRLEHALHRLTHMGRVVVLLHYAPIVATCEGEPREIYPYLGSSHLEDAVDRFPNVVMVLHGHVHHGARRGKTARGVPVVNCAWSETQPYQLLEL